MRFAKDGVPVIIALLFISLVVITAGWLINHTVSWLFYAVGILLSGFVLYFFRDPERKIPEGDYILAPADGKIISIEPVREDSYIKGSGTQISIFLSITDVHVNRHPVSGTVEHVAYHPGKYMVAWHPKASQENERAEFGVKHASGQRLFFRQITGYVARRIVFHTREGDRVRAGDRFGLMKFGSRMDLILPSDLSLQVGHGDRTVAGETIIASLKEPGDNVHSESR